MQAEINESAGVLAPLYSTVRSRDMLFVIMEQRKNAEKCNRFVQHITCAPESMAILCTNQQLLMLKYFAVIRTVLLISWGLIQPLIWENLVSLLLSFVMCFLRTIKLIVYCL